MAFLLRRNVPPGITVRAVLANVLLVRLVTSALLALPARRRWALLAALVVIVTLPPPVRYVLVADMAYWKVVRQPV